MNTFLITLCLAIGLTSSAFAASDSYTFKNATSSASSATSSTISNHDTMDIAAKSRLEALQTDSMHYALPRLDMTYIQLGVAQQNQQFRSSSRTEDFGNQSFFFNHSRGITNQLAVDFNVDYYMRSLDSRYGSSGVNQASVGVRSHFQALNLNWIDGLMLNYMPNGEYKDGTSKVALTAKIGFEEAVDIARWGMEVEGSTKDSYYFSNQLNLIGFYEMPFMKDLQAGVSAGMDMAHLSGSQQNIFGKVYGQYSFESVSAVQLDLKQVHEEDSSSALNEAQLGLSLNRVF